MDRPFLNPAARAFLEQINERQVTNLVEAIEFYADLTPEVATWLRKLNPEEVALLSEGIKLVNSGKTVGRFFRRLVLGAIAIFLLMTQFGDALKKMLASWKGIFS